MLFRSGELTGEQLPTVRDLIKMSQKLDRADSLPSPNIAAQVITVPARSADEVPSGKIVPALAA